jgi:hypothetical protein
MISEVLKNYYVGGIIVPPFEVYRGLALDSLIGNLW